MNKTVISIILASILIVALAGCNTKKNDTSTENIQGNAEINDTSENKAHIEIEAKNVDQIYRDAANSVLEATYKATSDSIQEIQDLPWAQELLKELKGLNDQHIDLNSYCKSDDYDSVDEVEAPPEVIENDTGIIEEAYDYTKEELPSDSEFIVTVDGKPIIYINDLAFDQNGYSSFDYNGTSWWVSKDEYKKTWKEMSEESRTYEYMTYAIKEGSVKLAYMEIKTGDIAEIEFLTGDHGEITELKFSAK